jgi:hypothetical protein
MADQSLELLQKIADNTAQSDSIKIAIIAAAAALFGALLTVLGNYVMARMTRETEEKRLRASIVTAERLRWLQDLRQRLAHFYRQLDMQYNFLKRPAGATDEGKKAYQKQMDDFSNDVNEQCNIITLMMNPAKPDQNDLKSALHEAIGFLNHCVQKRNAITSGAADLIIPISPREIDFNTPAYTEIKRKAFDSLTKIGIVTWNQIKDLK